MACQPLEGPGWSEGVPEVSDACPASDAVAEGRELDFDPAGTSGREAAGPRGKGRQLPASQSQYWTVRRGLRAPLFWKAVMCDAFQPRSPKVGCVEASQRPTFPVTTRQSAKKQRGVSVGHDGKCDGLA